MYHASKSPNAHRIIRIISGIFVLIALGASIVWLAKPGAFQPGAIHGQINVVAAENFWGNIAMQLGGTHVHVTSIITDPNADPHLYESNAENASAVSSAQVVIVNGLGYDDFMNKLLNVSYAQHRQVLTAADILQVQQGSNQHLWYDIPRIHEVAARITDAYIVADPAHTRDYQNNLADFNRSLLLLNNEVDTIKQRYGGTPVAYTEPVPGYLLSAAGLDVKTPISFAKSIEDGDDPSPVDTSAMDALMTRNAVKVLIYNAQATSPITEHVKSLAIQSGIPVIGMTETMPAQAQSYQSWMQDEINALQSALGT